MPPSAHSMRQSPSAISGSASTTRRPSKAARAHDVVELFLGGGVERVVDAHRDVRRGDQLRGSNRSPAPRFRQTARARSAPARACAPPRPRPRRLRIRAGFRSPPARGWPCRERRRCARARRRCGGRPRLRLRSARRHSPRRCAAASASASFIACSASVIVAPRRLAVGAPRRSRCRTGILRCAHAHSHQ